MDVHDPFTRRYVTISLISKGVVGETTTDLVNGGRRERKRSVEIVFGEWRKKKARERERERERERKRVVVRERSGALRLK